MGKKELRTIYIRLADVSTGEIYFDGSRCYDLRFRDKRKALHDLLDIYINKLRACDANLSIEFQSICAPVEELLPF